ncbi:hypothetical protein C8F04DRAFT_1269702 [Mycena alexandri]|uniref:Uncharacterized protein n=1 Tax=Mycena alexandri TaxID=1745969 RepID=A0AAD6SGB7_9AGAR|nr:hypothetical protein C8F04DRAFT_1269702 [Mycena alexandri]
MDTSSPFSGVHLETSRGATSSQIVRLPSWRPRQHGSGTPRSSSTNIVLTNHTPPSPVAPPRVEEPCSLKNNKSNTRVTDELLANKSFQHLIRFGNFSFFIFAPILFFIALAITHLPAHADTDLHIEFFDTPRHAYTDMATALNTLPAIPRVCSTPPAPSNTVQNATTAAAHTTKTMCAVSDVLADAKENVRAANQMLHVFCIQGEPTPHTGHDTRCVGFAAHSPMGRGCGGGMVGSSSSTGATAPASSAAAARAAGASPACQYLATRAIVFHLPLARIPSLPSSSSLTSPSPFPSPPNLERPHINDNDAHRDEDEDDGLISRMQKHHERKAARVPSVELTGWPSGGVTLPAWVKPEPGTLIGRAPKHA